MSSRLLNPQNLLAVFVIILMSCGIATAQETRTITDMAGRKVTIPVHVDKVICSGPGCLRYLTYLQGQSMAVAVDDIETRKKKFDARPYAMANPQFKKLPIFGEFRGHDNPELILGLEPQPQVIFKTYANMGYNPDELQEKTGIPVIVLKYSTLAYGKDKIFKSLKLMGEVIGKQQRAEQVCRFVDNCISELQQLTSGIPVNSYKTCYVGGIAKKGPHGLQSTEPGYPPFIFVNALNVASPKNSEKKPLEHANVSKEQIVAWNPEILFVDLSTSQLGINSGAIYELKSDKAYQSLDAVHKGNVYTLLPYNWYSRNYGSILADAYYVGKVLYPERFKSIDPKTKADEIYTFMVGKPVFKDMNEAFGSRAFERLSITEK